MSYLETPSGPKMGRQILGDFGGTNRVPTDWKYHGKPGKMQKKIPGMEKSWNFIFQVKIMEKSWNFITGLRQRHKINAAKWLEWQMFYIQESLLSEQAINTVFVNIFLLEDSTA